MDNEVLNDLGDELKSLLKNNKEITKELGLQQTIAAQLLAIKKNEGKFNQELIDSSKLLLENLNKVVDTESKIREKMKDMKDNNMFAGWTKSLKTLLIDFQAMRRDLKIAGAVFAGSLLNRGKEFLSTMEDTRKSVGMSGTQMVELSGATVGAATSGMLLGIGFKDAAEASAAIYNSTNNLNNVSSDAVKSISKLSSWYGVSAENGATLLKTFQEVNGNSQQSALNMMETSENVARAAGVPIGKLMNEVAGQSELFAKYSKNGGKNILDAAASAMKLGLSLQEVEGISTSLLNVDSSISAEMEASVLIGKQLNLNRARELAFAGDMDGMMKEVLTNVVSINEWEEMNVIQKQALADSLGLQVSQMQTMVVNQKEINRQQSSQESILGAIYMRGQGILNGIMNYKEELLAGANLAGGLMSSFPKMAGGIANSVGGVFSKIGGSIKGLASKVADGVGGIFGKFTSKFAKAGETVADKGADLFKKGDGISKNKDLVDDNKPKTKGGNPIVDWINTWKDMSKKALLNFALATGVMIVSLVGLAFALKLFSDVPWDAALIGMGSLMGLALSMKLIGNNTSGILKGSIAMGIMSLSLIPLAYALKEFNGINWDSLAKGAVAILGLTAMVFGLGALLSSGVGAVIFGAGVIGFVALGLAMMTLGAGLSMITNPMMNFVPLMTQLVEVAPGLTTLGGAFASMGAGLVAMSLGLLAVAPLLPVLGVLKSIGMIGGDTTSKGGDAKGKSTDEIIIEKLDKLIEVMSNKEMGVNIDGRKFGTILGKKNNEQKVYGV